MNSKLHTFPNCIHNTSTQSCDELLIRRVAKATAKRRQIQPPCTSIKNTYARAMSARDCVWYVVGYGLRSGRKIWLCKCEGCLSIVCPEKKRVQFERSSSWCRTHNLHSMFYRPLCIITIWIPFNISHFGIAVSHLISGYTPRRHDDAAESCAHVHAKRVHSKTPHSSPTTNSSDAHRRVK